MTKLASVQKIVNIEPIEGADKIEVATILGWEIVIKKDEYKIGDNVSYICIDTIVPELPEYEFLRERKFRVRTIKLRGKISQGLIVPLPTGKWKEGDDLTKILGVKKYVKPDNNPIVDEKPKMPKIWYKKIMYIFLYNYFYVWFPNLKKVSKSTFPSIIPKTDEERIQNIPSVLEKYKGMNFIVNFKLDGSSITILHEKKYGKSIFRICSRNFELHTKENDWYRVFADTNFKEEILKLVNHFKTNDIIVQGEAIGKFNGNHHNLKTNEIRIFNIFVNGKRLNQKDFMDTVVLLDIPHCPLFKELTLNHTMSEIIKISEIKDILNPNVHAEGLVWRCADENISFKVINNNFLIKNNE